MISVRDLLKTKGNAVWTIGPNESAYRALEVMADKDVGALVVVDDGNVVGIFSERDYARKVILKGKSSKNTPVSDLMTTRVCYVRPDQSIGECMALLTDKHVRHLPVMEDGNLIGLVSIGDVVKQMIAERDFTIQQLENYITGRW